MRAMTNMLRALQALMRIAMTVVVPGKMLAAGCGHAETKGTGDTPCEQLLVLVIVLQQHEPGLREEMNPNKTVMKAVTRPDVSILSD